MFIVVASNYSGDITGIEPFSTYEKAVDFCREKMGPRAPANQDVKYFENQNKPTIGNYVLETTDGSYGSCYRIFHRNLK